MKLVNAVHCAEMSSVFEIPPYAERARLHPGHYAFLGVELESAPSGCTGENFWARVTSNNNGKYVGRVWNSLIATERHGLKFGDRITFSADHVFDTWESDDWGD